MNRSRLSVREKMMIHLKSIYPEWITAHSLSKRLGAGTTEQIATMLARTDGIESRGKYAPKEYKLVK